MGEGVRECGSVGRMESGECLWLRRRREVQLDLLQARAQA
jgi:hypothetical protein